MRGLPEHACGTVTYRFHGVVNRQQPPSVDGVVRALAVAAGGVLMTRSIVIFFALALTAAHTAHADGSEPPRSEPLSFASSQGETVLTTAVVGSDLSLTFEFEKPVKSYLSADDPFVSIDLELDTDNNTKTGWTQVDDLRKGSDLSVNIILRLPSAGKSEDVFVSRWVIDPKDGPVGRMIATNTRLRVEGTQIHLLIPLSALSLRKGQEIRLIPVAQGRDVLVDQTLTLQ